MATQPPAQASLAHDLLAHFTDHNHAAVKEILSGSAIPTDSPPESLRSVAYHLDSSTISNLNAVLASAGSPPIDEHRVALRLFQREPSAVIQRQVESGKIKLDSTLKGDVARFLANNHDFDLRKSSLAGLTSDKSSDSSPMAFDGIPQDRVPELIRTVSTIQRTQNLASHPDTVPVLMNAGVTSAQAVSQIPRSNFVSAFELSLGAGTAAAIHDHATKIAFRNDSTILNIFQIIKGAGLAAIDGVGTVDTRMATFRRLAQDNNVDIDLEALFGGMDFCECDDCTTVLSPSNYFVELLQFLRNNTLDSRINPDGSPRFPNTSDPTYDKTALDVLLKRRPDLQHIQLTCANANTLIPYLDLANEVMESFIVHQEDSPILWSPDAQYVLHVFNVTDETSSELLSEPQHTNDLAYCILLRQVFPIGALPYHQPLACIRIYLSFLTTSRYELMSVFYNPYATPSHGGPYSASLDAELSGIYSQTESRATSAEYLGIIPEEFIILTKEAFWPKRYFEITQNTTLSDHDYHHKIGVRAPWEYWGFKSDSDMLSDDPSQIGLQWVKRQFLSRSGLNYPDVVDLIKTNYVNPVYPTGLDLLMFENLHFSYRFLQGLLNPHTRSKKARFKKLIDFLTIAQPCADAWIAAHAIDQQDTSNDCNDATPPCREDYAKFIYKWFDCLGKLVVLESGEGPTLPVYGFIVKYGDIRNSEAAMNSVVADTTDSFESLPSGLTAIGTLFTDGTITDNVDLSIDPAKPPKGKVTGSIQVDSIAYNADGTLFAGSETSIPGNTASGSATVATTNEFIRGTAAGTLAADASSASSSMISFQSSIAYLIVAIVPSVRTHYQITAVISAKDSGLYWIPDRKSEEKPSLVRWNIVVDSCDLSTVRILHLNGTGLCDDEWDNIHRFLRLRRRLGWSMDETDCAVHGLSIPSPQPPVRPKPSPSSSQVISWDDINDDKCDFCGKGLKSQQPGKKSCCNCSSSKDACSDVVRPEITAALIEEIASVKKLQIATGLDLTKLLALWDDISTAGNPSLYSQLFLTHNHLGVDPVFAADSNGNYLATATLIADHLPVLMAAFNLKAASLTIILDDSGLKDAQLKLENVTLIYRYMLLAQIFQVTPQILIQAAKLERYSFSLADANATLEFVNTTDKIVNSAFTIQQLGWIINDDDPNLKYTPSQLNVLKTTATLSKGLLSLSATYPDPSSDANATPPADGDVQKLLALLYAPDLSGAILVFLNGTKTYTTNAPAGLQVSIPSTLSAKLSYTQSTIPGTTVPRGLLTTTGLLTDAETTAALALFSSSDWADAIHRVAKQAADFYASYLAVVFPDQSKATKVLLAGDTPESVVAKRMFFLQGFMPYLRNSLARTLVVTTMSSVAELLSSDIVSTLLTDVLTISPTGGGESQSAMDVLLGLQASGQAASTTGTTWTGFLIPPTTDKFSFAGFGLTTPTSLIIDGIPVPFVRQQADPNDIWFTDAVSLTGGRLYKFSSGGQPVPGLEWFTSRTMATAIPASSLIADTGSATVSQVFLKLLKSAALITGFNLSFEELQFFASKGAISHFGFDLNAITFPGFQRMVSYTGLRGSISQQSTTLVDLFKWAATASAHTSLADLAQQIAGSTQWDASNISSLIGPDGWNYTSPASFCDEIIMLRIQTALTVARKVAVNIPTLFSWSSPLARFEAMREIAESIRNSIRSRYKLSDWEQAAKPLHDKLRISQRDALIAFLLHHPSLAPWGIKDADSLFEFFLIDVQMGSCLQTSRIKQAISTVQTFVQRCILGLEEDKYPTVTNSLIDQVRWQWMQKQTLWTANRKVFLFPESYLVPNLRDDKTDLYKSLEGTLQQQDANPQSVVDAYKGYLFGLDQRANLRVEGLFDDTSNAQNRLVHFIGKTRTTPYLFFYPSTTGNTGTSDITLAPSNGSYVIPYALGKRVIVMFAQLTSCTIPQKTPADLPSPGDKTSTLTATKSWEIKLAWSELQNGKWSHKQVTTDGIIENSTSATPPPLDMYKFVPYTQTEKLPDGTPINWILVMVYNSANTAIGGFEFHGNQAFVTSTAVSKLPTLKWDFRTSFHFCMSSLSNWAPAGTDVPTIYSLQDPPNGSTFDPTTHPYIQYPLGSVGSTMVATIDGVSTNVDFYHKFSHALLNDVNATDGLTTLFNTLQTQYTADTTAFGESSSTATSVSFNELSQPYSVYNWEMGFHATTELGTILWQNNSFDAALAMFHNVFNPYANGADETRVWQWKPFSEVDTSSLLEALFNQLQPDKPDDPNGPINSWRDNPYAPHVVARQRPVAYMKWTVLTYLQILIAYGDYYYRQNSLEALPQALQLYILASHIYGPTAQQIPKRGTVKPQTYHSLLSKWDAFSNSVVQLELAFPFSNQTSHAVEFVGNEIACANIFGFATTHYFAIPNNPQLRSIRALIDSRLYNIRHCLDINGNSISYPLWDPPIDPAALVRAAAAGLSISSFLNDLNAPMPNYRFFYLLQKALELCAELKSSSSMFLGIKEKRDGEALGLLKARQDSAMQNLVMELRSRQLDEVNRTLDQLRESRNGVQYRYKYFAQLAGQTVPSLTETDTSYKEIDITIPAPKTDGDMVMSLPEQTEHDEAGNANEVNSKIGPAETIAGVLFSLPIVTSKVAPWGLGIGFGWGASNFGQATMAYARFMRIESDGHSFNSSDAGRKATNIKQFQERVQAANSAGYELMNINKQIITQNSRIQAAAQEVTNQQKIIDDAQESLDFLTSKYTNDELYAFLEGQVRTTFYQTYTLAYDLAKKAEAAFLFERGPIQAQQLAPSGSASFIQYGYWDPARDGLQCGEALYVSLKQLEAAYQTRRPHDFEISKTVSLRQVAPLALIQLRESGTCQFDLPEVLFDIDFPGHYFRRLRAVTVTMPCTVSPVVGVNATLTLTDHTWRLSTSGATDARSYAMKPPGGDGGPDSRFASSALPISSIAVSTGQADSGLFELAFSSERYLPFEGAGAISSWKLELPSTALQAFDYGSITDVLFNLRYTSLNGGEQFKSAAVGSVNAFAKSVDSLADSQGLFVAFDLQIDFSSAWARATAGPAAASLLTSAAGAGAPSTRVFNLDGLAQRLPFYARATKAKPTAQDVTVITETTVAADAFSLRTSASDDAVALAQVPGDDNLGAAQMYRSSDQIARLMSGTGVSWQLLMNDGGKADLVVQRIWVFIRFTISTGS
ncbi:hypothetical protein IFR05_001927 [Cadophora sp. M221]|nr:hypothetical protein IFR05_001927 [Cadophora sp. M221]